MSIEYFKDITNTLKNNKRAMEKIISNIRICDYNAAISSLKTQIAEIDALLKDKDETEKQ